MYLYFIMKMIKHPVPLYLYIVASIATSKTLQFVTSSFNIQIKIEVS